MKSNGFAHSLSQRENDSEFAALNLGIIGFGNIGRQHLKAAKECPNWNVVAVADTHFDETDVDLKDVVVYRDWQELLLHPELDAISICVPHHLHFSMTLAALEAGKHVLVEKPLALNCEEGQILVEAARERNLVLMVEMTHRFYPPLQEARALVQSGRIGSIYAIEDRIVEPVSSQLLPWMQQKHSAGGGVALTNGVHMLDRIAAITGQALTFQSGTAGFSAGLGDVEDTAAMLLQLENGAPVQLLVSWPRSSGTGSCDDELTIYGTTGTLRVWAWRGWRLESLDGTTPALEKLCYPPDSAISARVQVGVRLAIEEFVVAVGKGEEHPTAQAALDAQALVEEFYAFTNVRACESNYRLESNQLARV